MAIDPDHKSCWWDVRQLAQVSGDSAAIRGSEIAGQPGGSRREMAIGSQHGARGRANDPPSFGIEFGNTLAAKFDSSPIHSPNQGFRALVAKNVGMYSATTESVAISS